MDAALLVRAQDELGSRWILSSHSRTIIIMVSQGWKVAGDLSTIARPKDGQCEAADPSGRDIVNGQ